MNTIITEAVLPTYQEYIKLETEKKALEAKLKDLKAKIIAYHKETGADKINDKGFCSALVNGSRETLLRDVIEEKFGKLPPECIKTTKYEQIRIGTVLNG